MEAQLYSLRASATRPTEKHWAAPYTSSLLPRSRARSRCGVGAFAPAPWAVPTWPPPTCSRPVSGVGLGLFVMRGPYRGLPAPALNCFSLCDLRLFVSKRMFFFLLATAHRTARPRLSFSTTLTQTPSMPLPI